MSMEKKERKILNKENVVQLQKDVLSILKIKQKVVELLIKNVLGKVIKLQLHGIMVVKMF